MLCMKVFHTLHYNLDMKMGFVYLNCYKQDTLYLNYNYF